MFSGTFGQICAHPDIQDMQLQPDVGLVLSDDLNAVHVAEVGQQGHEVGPCVDHMTDAVAGAHQQRHICLFLPLLHKDKPGVQTCILKSFDRVQLKFVFKLSFQNNGRVLPVVLI